MKRRLKALFISSFAMSLTATCAQSQNLHPLSGNMEKLTVTIKPDRDVYFSGELYKVFFEVINPTPVPLQVETPFQQSGCVSLFRKKGDELISMDGVDGGCRDSGAAPTITMGSGERRISVLTPFGFEGKGWPALTSGNGMDLPAGTYVLKYEYGPGAEVEFQIIDPKIEAEAIVRVNDRMVSMRPDRTDRQPIATYVQVLAFRWQNESHICVAQSFVNSLWRPDAEPRVLGPGNFKRVASSYEPVASMTATADPGENLSIEWRTTSGRIERIHYPASYEVQEVRERAEKLMIEDLKKDQ